MIVNLMKLKIESLKNFIYRFNKEKLLMHWLLKIYKNKNKYKKLLIKKIFLNLIINMISIKNQDSIQHKFKRYFQNNHLIQIKKKGDLIS